MSEPPIEVRKMAPNGRDVFAVWWECPSCGKKVDKNDRFCRSCGERMLSSADPR